MVLRLTCVKKCRLNKVLKLIVKKKEDIPRDDELKFRERCKAVLDKWTPIIDAHVPPKDGSPTAAAEVTPAPAASEEPTKEETPTEKADETAEKSEEPEATKEDERTEAKSEEEATNEEASKPEEEAEAVSAAEEKVEEKDEEKEIAKEGTPAADKENVATEAEASA